MKERITHKIYFLCFIFFQMIGFLFLFNKHLNIINLLLICFLSVFLSLLISDKYIIKLYNMFLNIIKTNKLKLSSKDKLYYFIYFFILLITWLPYFIIFYPGMFSYDVHNQIGIYTTCQPLFHSLILNIFYNISNNRNTGMALYTFIQIIIFASSLAYSLLLMYRVRMNKYIRFLTLMFYSFLPIFPLMSISITKDILFVSFILYLIVSIVYYELDRELFWKKRMDILFIVSSVLVGLLRNNGIYVMLAFLFVNALLSKEKRYNRLSIISMFLIVLSFLTLLFSLHPVLEHDNEKYSVIYQQMGFIYNNVEVDNDIKKQIKEYVPDAKDYYYFLSDNLKGTGLGYKDKAGFMKLSMKLFLYYPMESIESFLRTNEGSYFLFDSRSTNVYLGSYFFFTFRSGFDVSYNKRFVKIRNKIFLWMDGNGYQKFFVTNVLFNLSLYFWILLLCLSLTIYNKRKISSIYLLLLFLFVTIVLGPCIIIRYMLPIIVAIPPLMIRANNERDNIK